MSKLKVGIISAGGIVRWAHLPAIKKIDNIEVVAICDVNEEQAITVASEYDIKLCYKDYKQMLAEANIDAVIIGTPTCFHSPQAIDALKAGKHVLLEKPDAMNVDEAMETMRVAEETGKTLMVIRNNRFYPASQFLKKYIEDGHMGEIYAARCHWQRRENYFEPGNWFVNKKLSGGGPLLDLGVHMIDLGMWLMGNPSPITVSGSTFQKIPPKTPATAEKLFDVEDLAMGFIRFDNGSCMSLEISWASHIEKEIKYLELRGTKAGCTISDNNIKIWTTINGVITDIIPKVSTEENGHLYNIKHFVDVVLNGAKPIFIPQEGVNMMKILTGIYQSSELGHEINY